MILALAVGFETVALAAMIGLGGVNLGLTVLSVALILVVLTVVTERRRAKPNPPTCFWTLRRFDQPLKEQGRPVPMVNVDFSSTEFSIETRRFGRRGQDWLWN